MGKFEKRGLDEEEVKFRRTAQNVFQTLQPTNKKLTYAMVLDVMRKARKKNWSPDDMENALKRMLTLRKKRLNKRFKESALKCSHVSTTPK